LNSNGTLNLSEIGNGSSATEEKYGESKTQSASRTSNVGVEAGALSIINGALRNHESRITGKQRDTSETIIKAAPVRNVRFADQVHRDNMAGDNGKRNQGERGQAFSSSLASELDKYSRRKQQSDDSRSTLRLESSDYFISLGKRNVYMQEYLREKRKYLQSEASRIQTAIRAAEAYHILESTQGVSLT